MSLIESGFSTLRGIADQSESPTPLACSSCENIQGRVSLNIRSSLASGCGSATRSVAAQGSVAGVSQTAGPGLMQVSGQLRAASHCDRSCERACCDGPGDYMAVCGWTGEVECNCPIKLARHESRRLGQTPNLDWPSCMI
ncbi:hypothetical protein DPEC_G00348400 [Dallia pectoralis]|uniref:Uncharacterized protein n=1 Tax=Dallia pectoralis TaxID=75939 RepID=A0ACC2F170_DALPE|nr:hypothetical protein DPEC_G00348400 [Dallia pectoralis]